MKKKTIVLGASPNPERYSFKATTSLKKMGHPVLPLGIRKGMIEEEEIILDKLIYTGVDTITLYLNPEIQRKYYSYILSTRPRRLIFNPGTENPELQKLAEAHGIECVEACTLVMLQTGQYE
jgi:uncharacterized protein